MIFNEGGESQQDLRRGRIAPWTVSFVAHALALLVLANVALLQPVTFEPVAPRYSVSLVSVPAVPEQKPPKPIVLPPLVRREIAEMTAPTVPSPTPVAPMPVIPQTDPKPSVVPVAPAPAGFPSVRAEQAAPARPAPVVNTFPTATVAATNKPAPKVQTGGFGDPNGLPGEGKPGAKLTAAKLGSFDLPPGPGTGNGTGGATGTKGVVVASAGFGSGQIAGAPTGTGSGGGTRRQVVTQSGFGDAPPVATGTGRAGAGRPSAAPKVIPAEILYKPNPNYTEAARALKLEGEVLAEVVFPANGQPRVLRIIRGLGHGLDEAATQAIAKIRFKPAQEDGKPVDSTAIVHIVFKIA